MQAKITKRSDTEVTFNIIADQHEIKHSLEHSYERYRPQVKAPGFRPGKAPDHIVAREIGDNVIQGDTLEHTVSHAYSDAVVQEKLSVIASPKINIQKWVPYETLEFEATVEIIPPVKLPDYKKIKKKLPEVKVDEAKIDEVVEDLRRRLATRTPAIAGAEIGNEVKIDFEGRRDGKVIEGAVGKNHPLKLGSNSFIPGFEEQLVGLKVGDDKTFEVTFPKDYHEKSLAGKPVEFRVKVHEVSALNLPEVNDKFAAEIGPFKNVSEMRADIKDQLTVEAEQEAERKFENELLDEIVGKASTKVPEPLVRQQLERMKAEVSQRLASSGLNMEQYLQMQQKNQEEFERELLPEAEKRVKLALVLSEVAKSEQLAVDAEEVEREVEDLRQRYTDPQMQKELAGDHIKEDVYNHLMAGKVIRKLMDYARS